LQQPNDDDHRGAHGRADQRGLVARCAHLAEQEIVKPGRRRAVTGMRVDLLREKPKRQRRHHEHADRRVRMHAIRSAQPANAQKTYGYHRAGILVALLNSTTLVLISLGIFYEAYQRFLDPPNVQSGILISVGLIAVVINLVTALLVHRGSEHDLNLRSVFVHLMGDVLSTVGAVIAGVIIYFTNANWLDPLVSVLIGFLILYNAWGILKDAIDILLEATPRDVDVQAMVKDIAQIDGVLGVHDIHVWSLTQSLRTMSAHILTDDLHISVGADIQHQINEMLYHRYNITHATLQLECVDCSPDELYCDLNGHVHTGASPVVQHSDRHSSR